MRYFYHILDVFTDRPFGGNQLAVLPDARGLDGATMQRIAREFNFSETTFVLPPADPVNTRQVRIFTPFKELPFAGHPNIGTAIALVASGEVEAGELRFEEGAGLVPVRVEQTADGGLRAELTAPPEGDEHRKPVHVDADEIEAVRPFAATDLRRWVEPAAAEQPPVPPEQPEPGEDSGPRLVF